MSEVQFTPVTPSQAVSVPEVVVGASPSAPAAPAQVAPPSETPAADAQAPETDPKMGRRFAELTRRQRELVQRELALKAQAEAVEPIAKAIEQAKASKNPAKILEAAGFSLDDVIEFYANGAEETPAAPEKSVEELVDERLEAKRQTDAEAERVARVEKQISDFKASIKQAAESNADAYELVNRFNQHDLVYDVVLQHHAESGEVLPVEQALALVEQHLFSQISGLKKIQPKAPEPTPQASIPGREPRTTFTLSQSQAAPTQPAQTKLSPQQAKDRAASMLRFNN